MPPTPTWLMWEHDSKIAENFIEGSNRGTLSSIRQKNFTNLIWVSTFFLWCLLKYFPPDAYFLFFLLFFLHRNSSLAFYVFFFFILYNQRFFCFSILEKKVKSGRCIVILIKTLLTHQLLNCTRQNKLIWVEIRFMKML